MKQITPLIKIIQKNFKLLLRSKFSSLIIILGPLFLILLLGIAFNNTNSMALNIGVYSEEYTDTVNIFTDKLSEKQYNVEKTSSELDCINKIKINKLNACVIFPPNLDLEKGIGNNTLTFYVDNSRINMVFIIIEALSSKFSEKSKEISMDLTNTLLQKLESTRVEIFNKKPLLSEIKKLNKDSTDKLEQIKIDLNSLDISINTNDFKTTETSTKLDEIEKQNNEIEKAGAYFVDISSHLEDIESDVESLESEENSASISDIKDLINTTQSKVNEANTLIEDQQTNTDKKITELKLLIKDINLNIEKTKNKINDVASSRSKITDKLDKIKEKINSVNENINEIDKSFKKIDENIGSIQITDADKIVSPIKTDIRGVESEITYLEGLFPNLLVIIIMFISILLSTSLVMMEKKSPAFFRNKITPVDDIIFLLGYYLTCLLIVLLQIFVIVIISSILFNIQIIIPTLKMLPYIILIISLFSFIGIIIGQMFKTEETSAIAAVSISTIFLFLSDIIIPIGMMPEAIRNIIRYSPLILSANFLKIGLKYGIQPVLSQLYYISIYVIILLVLIIVLQKLISKKFLTKLILLQQKKLLKRSKIKEDKQKDKLLFKKG